MKKIFLAIAIIATLCTVASCNKTTNNAEAETEVVGCAAEVDSLTTDSCSLDTVEVVTEEAVTE